MSNWPARSDAKKMVFSSSLTIGLTSFADVFTPGWASPPRRPLRVARVAK
jgi:hypothetical protein